ncbi:hypothetical protein F5Y18DRAFT_79418 [Xylariaceae sp. FL1019]|nr:hypothetical protein F5Y18DRAFT_79418 [Xylariaceae sp. FL1019]
MNLSAWSLHCHISSHLECGMTLVVKNGVDSFPSIPSEYLHHGAQGIIELWLLVRLSYPHIASRSRLRITLALESYICGMYREIGKRHGFEWDRKMCNMTAL